MFYISLSSSYAGNACAIRKSINNYTSQKSETHFFDWLVTSMKSVNEVLQGKPLMFVNKKIHPNILDKMYSNVTTIHFLNFDKLISHHDIKRFNSNKIFNVTELYKRRYVRLLNILKTEKNICFIRHCKGFNDIEEDEIDIFYKNIQKINTNLIFYFVLITDNDDNKMKLPKNLNIKPNFIHINLNNYLNYDTVTNEPDEFQRTIKKHKYIFDVIDIYFTQKQ